LLSQYLQPLQSESFLSDNELKALFGNLSEIAAFQRMFLRSLEEAVNIDGDFHAFDTTDQFKVCTRHLCTVYGTPHLHRTSELWVTLASLRERKMMATAVLPQIC
jgi:hypothetical protein